MPSEPRAVRYTPDGRLVIVACIGGEVLIIDPATGQITSCMQYSVRGSASNIGQVPGDGYLDISFDGRRFLSCSLDQLVRVCDTATGEPCYDPLRHERRAKLGRFSPDAQFLLTTEQLSTVRIWDATTGGQTEYALTHPLNSINDACFSPNSQYVLTACEDGMARVWDWRTGTLVCPPYQHARGVGGACFTPDGAFVVTAARDFTARVWEWHTGKPVTPPLSISGVGIRVITTPDGKHAIVSGMGSFIDIFNLGDLYRNELELDDLCALGEILCGQRIHEGGGVVNLTTDEWLDRWKRLDDRRPEYLRFQSSPEEVLKWHRREADKKLAAGQKLAAVWHLNRLIVKEPENWQHYRDLGRLYGVRGQMDAADADHAKAFELLPAEAKRSLLESRVQTIAQASAQQQEQTMADLKAHLAAKAESGLGQEDARLALSTAQSLERSGNSELAASTYQSFAEVIGRNTDESSADIVKKMHGAARRLTLIGNEIEYQGHNLDGSPFDGAACQGKIVLVEFWSTCCPNWQTEIINASRNYHLYHDRGLEIVSVNLGQDRQRLERFLERNPVPWVVLHTDGAGWNHPLAVHCGVSSVPARFLVGRDGKVISVNARGTELDELLKNLIDPPYATKGNHTLLDISAKTNLTLTQQLGNLPDNDLRELPRGDQTFAGVKFHVADAVILLACQNLRDRPEKVEGIAVGGSFSKACFLHGTASWGCEDGTVIGLYRVNYQGGAVAEIPIVFGEDVRNWICKTEQKPVTRGTIAWIGRNPAVRRWGEAIRLYITAWENPQPDKKVLSIDYVSLNTKASPFCVAITLEQAADTPTDEAASDSPSE